MDVERKGKGGETCVEWREFLALSAVYRLVEIANDFTYPDVERLDAAAECFVQGVDPWEGSRNATRRRAAARAA